MNEVGEFGLEGGLGVSEIACAGDGDLRFSNIQVVSRTLPTFMAA